MRLQPFVYLLITVAHGFSKDVVFKKFHDVPRQNKELFEEKIVEEFPSTSVLISTRDLGILDDITTIKDNNLITLRHLKLDYEPDLQIDYLNSTLEYLSMRIGIKAGDDVVFSGKIQVNENRKPVGDVSYILKNFKGNGIVGLAADENSAFTSTNYLIEYQEDETILNGTFWKKKNTRRYEIDASYLPAEQVKRGVRRVINGVLKKRLDASLAEVQLSKVFGLKRSNIGSIKKKTREFYNGIVDALLEQVNKLIVEKNLSKVPLIDLNIPFTYKLAGITVSGRVIAWEGWIKNLATFVRRGSVTVTLDGKDIVLLGEFGLEDLELGYDVCAVQIAGFGPYVKLSGIVGKNEGRFAVAINFQNKSVMLRNFETTKFDNIKIRIEGLGPLNWLASKIANKIMNMVKKDILPMVERKIEEEVRNQFKNIDVVAMIQNYFPYALKKRNLIE